MIVTPRMLLAAARRACVEKGGDRGAVFHAGCLVVAFRAPSATEHPHAWRYSVGSLHTLDIDRAGARRAVQAIDRRIP